MPKTNDREAFTARVLMSITEDMRDLSEATERVHLQIETLAAEHGVALPAED